MYTLKQIVIYYKYTPYIAFFIVCFIGESKRVFKVIKHVLISVN